MMEASPWINYVKGNCCERLNSAWKSRKISKFWFRRSKKQRKTINNKWINKMLIFLMEMEQILLHTDYAVFKDQLLRFVKLNIPSCTIFAFRVLLTEMDADTRHHMTVIRSYQRSPLKSRSFFMTFCLQAITLWFIIKGRFG